MASAPNQADETHGSTDYVYFLSALIGTGATSKVYKGRNKRTGELVAVKVLKPSNMDKHAQNELAALRKLEHPNIVKLLDEQKETNTNGTLVVLEWCLGGSLLSVLEQPQHKYGLPEAEFLIILHDICEAVCFLNKKRIVHRDVKPGNILLYITASQRHVYKLTDFGTVYFQESQSVMDSDGTYEYLHPAMFRKALLKQKVDVEFDSYVDLWSFGCTLMHCAIGRLPFRPCLGRMDVKSMERMIINKPKDVIYATQEESTKEISYYTELPSTCRISKHLQQMLLPLLQGLLEPDPNLSLQHDSLEYSVDKLTSMEVVTVLLVTNASHNTVYVDRETNIVTLKDVIEQIVVVKTSEQILWYNNRELDSFSVTTVPTSDQNPIILIPSANALWSQHLNHMEILDLPEPPGAIHPPASFALARDVAGFVHNGLHTVQLMHHVQQILRLLCETFVKNYKGKLEDGLEMEWLELTSFKNQVELTVDHTHMVILCSSLKHIPKYQREFTTMTKSVTKTRETLKGLNKKFFHLQRSGDAYPLKDADAADDKIRSLRAVTCDSHLEAECVEKLNDVVRRVMNIYEDFKRDKTNGVHGYNHKQIHKLKRNLLCDLMVRHSDILSKCTTTSEKVYVASRALIITFLECRWKRELARKGLKELKEKYADFFMKLQEKQQNMVDHITKLNDHLTEKDSGFFSGIRDRKPISRHDSMTSQGTSSGQPLDSASGSSFIYGSSLDVEHPSTKQRHPSGRSVNGHAGEELQRKTPDTATGNELLQTIRSEFGHLQKIHHYTKDVLQHTRTDIKSLTQRDSGVNMLTTTGSGLSQTSFPPFSDVNS